MSAFRLATPGHLALEAPEGKPWRILLYEADWLGPVGIRTVREGRARVGPVGSMAGGGSPLVPDPRPFDGEDALGRFSGVVIRWSPPELGIVTSARAYAERPLLVFRVEATRDLHGIATGDFSEPSVSWPWLRPAERSREGFPEGVGSFGHQLAEFALPSFADDACEGFFLLPHRPPVVSPLLLASDRRALLLAPLDAFHEQTIAVPHRGAPAGRGVLCGWQGDLDRVPVGFATELAIFAGSSPRALIEDWLAILRARHRPVRPSRYADDLLSRLSYWTDNGAAYWYRTEPGRDVAGTLGDTLDGLRAAGVPIHAVQLDSWVYPHQTLRALNDAETVVPPTGMLAWEPREDLLPDGIAALRHRLGDPPLVLHSRHFSSHSPYFDDREAWTDGDHAHPTDPAFAEILLAQAAAWGAVTYEQDWMVESFTGVRGLRERPGRARAWQEGLDRAAAEHGLTLQWCMASPPDFLQTMTLRQVTSIRTSGDYRYIAGSGALWTWFLLTNALARGLGLWPFKDVFLSSRDGSGLDGDPRAEAEALLAALSAGPVGIGDRIGRTDPDVVFRTCRSDGVLLKPDVPIAAIDRCFRRSPLSRGEPLVGESFTMHEGVRWNYVIGLNPHADGEDLRFRVALTELGAYRPMSPVLDYEWRTGTFHRLDPEDTIHFELEPLGWGLHLLCPILPGDFALFGDVVRYASVGDRRVRAVRSDGGVLQIELLGAPGEEVELRGWSRRELGRVELRTETVGGWRSLARDGRDTARWSRDTATGEWRVRVRFGASARVRLRLLAA